jgi:lysozyme
MRPSAWAFALTSAFLLALALISLELYRAGLVRFNYPDPERYPVWGVDVSRHQGVIDWPTVRGDGVAFAFIKATEGATHQDTRFEENWDGAGEAGIARGAYHFFTFCARGAEQAENFLGRVTPLVAELPPAVDVEFAGNCQGWGSVAEIRDELATYLAMVEERLGRKPVVYYTRKAAKTILEERHRGYPLWPRSIVGAPDVALLGPWTFWQYADNARIPGVRGAVDLDVFRDGRGDFEVLAHPSER